MRASIAHDLWLRERDPMAARHYLRRELAHRLAMHVLDMGSSAITEGADLIHRQEYMAASVFAFSEGELAVLLARAYEVGRSAR